MRGQVRLRFQGYPALLKMRSKAGTSIAHACSTITWPDAAFRLEVYPQDTPLGLPQAVGHGGHRDRLAEFDRSFYISGNSRIGVRDMLSAEVQA